MICTFFGHGDAADNIRDKIKNAVESLISEGVNQFYVGNNGNFDYMVQSVLVELRRAGTDIELTVVISYIDEKVICAEQKDSMYPESLESVPLRFAISRRNDYMIASSQIVVAYVRHNFSNSHKWLEKAKKKGLRVINLAEM